MGLVVVEEVTRYGSASDCSLSSTYPAVAERDPLIERNNACPVVVERVWRLLLLWRSSWDRLFLFFGIWVEKRPRHVRARQSRLLPLLSKGGVSHRWSLGGESVTPNAGRRRGNRQGRAHWQTHKSKDRTREANGFDSECLIYVKNLERIVSKDKTASLVFRFCIS